MWPVVAVVVMRFVVGCGCGGDGFVGFDCVFYVVAVVIVGVVMIGFVGFFFFSVVVAGSGL